MSYRIYGGLRFFERAEMANALAYLRLVQMHSDDGAFSGGEFTLMRALVIKP